MRVRERLDSVVSHLAESLLAVDRQPHVVVADRKTRGERDGKVKVLSTSRRVACTMGTPPNRNWTLTGRPLATDAVVIRMNTFSLLHDVA